MSRVRRTAGAATAGLRERPGMARMRHLVPALVVLAIVASAVGAYSARGATAGYSGTVSAAGVRRHDYVLQVSGSGTLSASLTWSTPSARLALGVSHRADSDDPWVWMKAVSGAQPLTLNVPVTAGQWRVYVKAKSGTTSYSMSVSYPSAPPASTPFLTIMLGRAQIKQTVDNSCQVVAGQATTLQDVATELSAHGLRATVPVTPSEIGQSTQKCVGGILYASWDDLAQLRDTYGWDAVPRGMTNDVITGLTGQALQDATCGALPTFYAEGYPDAWGMYAYPQNRFTSANQEVVKTCYSYGRRYTGAGDVNHMPAAPPYWARVVSVNAGQCNDTSLACYNDPNVKNGRRYMLPSQLDKGVSTAPGSWGAIQFYRFVTGSYGSRSSALGQPAWDCTGTDPRTHWSHQPEAYCWNDFLTFLDNLPAGVTDGSPADVARAYGREMTPGDDPDPTLVAR